MLVYEFVFASLLYVHHLHSMKLKYSASENKGGEKKAVATAVYVSYSPRMSEQRHTYNFQWILALPWWSLLQIQLEIRLISMKNTYGSEGIFFFKYERRSNVFEKGNKMVVWSCRHNANISKFKLASI